MGWLRPRIRFGAWLALAALALNLAFAFGHHHFSDTHSIAGVHRTDGAGHSDGDDDDHHRSTADHPCLTCALALAAAIAANPPALPAQVWTRATDTATAPAFGPRQSDRTSFRARAPPPA